MDPHVQRMAQVLMQAQERFSGQIYDTQTFDEQGNQVETCPALKTVVDGRTVNVMLFDVPGASDHFSVVVNADPKFTLNLREEGRFDFIMKFLKRLEDHVVGVADFDSRFLVGGQPTDTVIGFLRRDDVRSRILALDPFLTVVFSDGNVRATFPLTPDKGWTLDELQARIQGLIDLAKDAEATA